MQDRGLSVEEQLQLVVERMATAYLRARGFAADGQPLSEERVRQEAFEDGMATNSPVFDDEAEARLARVLVR